MKHQSEKPSSETALVKKHFLVKTTDLTKPELKLQALNHLWFKYDWHTRLTKLNEVIWELADQTIRRFVVKEILRPKGLTAEYTEPEQKVRAIHSWVTQHIEVVMERGEYLALPRETLEDRFGDCDDIAILIATMAQSIGLDANVLIGPVAPDPKHGMWVSSTGLDLPGKPAHMLVEIGTPELCRLDAKSGEVKCKKVFRTVDGTMKHGGYARLKRVEALAGQKKQVTKFRRTVSGAISVLEMVFWFALLVFAFMWYRKFTKGANDTNDIAYG